jgi:hypothetical protein
VIGTANSKIIAETNAMKGVNLQASQRYISTDETITAASDAQMM